MERDCEEGEMETKLRQGFLLSHCSKRASPSTPPPAWRLGDFSTVADSKEFLVKPVVSVRELCADLWEIEQFRPLSNRRRSQRRDSPRDSPVHEHQPPSRSSSRKQIASKLDHRLLLHRNDHLVQPLSPSSSNHYGLGSSSKLLKVLNRIWNLEKQNTANVSLVKALRLELDQCREEIKQRDVFGSLKKELDNERKVRKQTESLHKKLTRELCEAKHCLSKALKDLEKERKERVVVENLCDEFAKVVRVYEEDKEKKKRRSDSREEIEKRRDNRLKVMKKRQDSSSEGDKIHPESSSYESLEKSKILLRNVKMRGEDGYSSSLKDKLMEARVESRRLRSLKPESSPSHSVQG